MRLVMRAVSLWDLLWRYLETFWQMFSTNRTNFIPLQIQCCQRFIFLKQNFNTVLNIFADGVIIFLQVNTGLKTLDLRFNKIDSQGAGYLAQGLKVPWGQSPKIHNPHHQSHCHPNTTLPASCFPTYSTVLNSRRTWCWRISIWAATTSRPKGLLICQNYWRYLEHFR